jgi:pseudouridine-5'-phosphate glycosidase
VSADLQELAQTPVIVVCAGAKAILDLPATLEYLETHGVTVVGYGTDELPAFYSRSSGLRVDVRCDSAAEVAAIWRAKQRLGLPGGLLVTVPIPATGRNPAAEIAPAIEQAVAEATGARAALRGGDTLPADAPGRDHRRAQPARQPGAAQEQRAGRRGDRGRAASAD